MLTRADIRNQIVYDTDAHFVGATAATSMDRYNHQINRIYRKVVNTRYWQWRLITETLTTPSNGVFNLPSLSDNVHAVLGPLPTIAPFEKLTDYVEDRQARTLTFYDSDDAVDVSVDTIRVQFYKMNLDLALDTEEPMLPYNFRPMLYHGATEHFLRRMGRESEAREHGREFAEFMRQMRVQDVTAMTHRDPHEQAAVPTDIGSNEIDFSEV